MPSSNSTSDKKSKSSRASSKAKHTGKPVKSSRKSSHRLDDLPDVNYPKFRNLREPLSDIDGDNNDFEDGKSEIRELTDSEYEESKAQDDFDYDSDIKKSDTSSDGDSDTNNDEYYLENEAEEDERNIKEIADDATEQLQDSIGQIANGDDSDEDEQRDTNALTTMNAIMEYNKRLIQKLEALEAKTGELKKGDIQHSVDDTMHEVYSKYNKKEQSTGTHQSHSFELPVGDMLKGYGAFSTSINEVKDFKKNADDEASTVQDDDDNKIRIGDGEKDDIVVKVEATKSGITFSIHIPRN